MSRQAMVIVVGTSHTIQIGEPELLPYLVSLCRKFDVRAVAEEMNEEALTEKDHAASIPMQVASSLQLPHRFCDPNRAERASLEIRQENEIRVQASPSNSTLSESDIAARVTKSHAKRERYWLDQLHSLNVWPVLFICGADHVESFRNLLAQQSIVAHVAAEDWAPNNTVGMDAPQGARPSPRH